MDGIPVGEAARRLGVSPRRVRSMIHEGIIEASDVSGVWLIDPASLPPSSQRAGRPMSQRIAWALADVVEGRKRSAVSDSELSRLRAKWRAIPRDNSMEYVRSWMSRRADRIRFSAPVPGDLIEDERFVRSGRSDARSGMVSPSFAEGYVERESLDELIFSHLLLPASGPENVIVHVVDKVPNDIPLLIAIADLAEAHARERQQAQLLLNELLERV